MRITTNTCIISAHIIPWSIVKLKRSWRTQEEATDWNPIWEETYQIEKCCKFQEKTTNCLRNSCLAGALLLLQFRSIILRRLNYSLQNVIPFSHEMNNRIYLQLDFDFKICLSLSCLWNKRTRNTCINWKSSCVLFYSFDIIPTNWILPKVLTRNGQGVDGINFNDSHCLISCWSIIIHHHEKFK